MNYDFDFYPLSSKNWVAVSNGDCKIWDYLTNQIVKTISIPKLDSVPKTVIGEYFSSCKFSKDGKYLLTIKIYTAFNYFTGSNTRYDTLDIYKTETWQTRK